MDVATARYGSLTKVAMPSTLYVHRPLLNGHTLALWAKRAGFKSIIPPADMHVTIAFSRRPVDWMKIGEGYPVTPKLVIFEGGPRNLTRFDGGAVVLVFDSAELRWRNEDIRAAGASWDWPDYHPHVTLSYETGDLDVDSIAPYQGRLVFGPETWEPVEEDWKTNIAERKT